MTAERPCSCGPGFCARRAGVAHFGACQGRPAGDTPSDVAEPCSACTAPHQWPGAPCWLCGHPDVDKPDLVEAQDWLDCLEHRIRAADVYAVQNNAKRSMSFRQALDALIEERSSLSQGRQVVDGSSLNPPDTDP